MSEVKFKNGKTVEADVYGASLFYQDAHRQTLEIVFSENSMSFEEAKSIWKDSESTSEITITSIIFTEDNIPQTTVSLQANFTIPVELKYVQVGDEFKLRMKLAQMSTLEIAQANQAKDITNIEAALIELAEMEATNNG